MSDETCPKVVYRGDVWSSRSARCGKPVKRDGLCGVHARSADVRAERDATWKAQSKARDEATRLASVLTAASAIPFGSRDDRITLTAVAAERLLSVLTAK